MEEREDDTFQLDGRCDNRKVLGNEAETQLERNTDRREMVGNGHYPSPYQMMLTACGKHNQSSCAGACAHRTNYSLIGGILNASN